MIQKSFYPIDLARAVRRYLIQQNITIQPLEVIKTFFEILFFTSLLTEEGKRNYCDTIWLNPSNIEHDPNDFKLKDHWSFIPFSTPINFNINNLSKLTSATDPRTSSLVVYVDENNKLFIYGLIDQVNQYYEYVNHNLEINPERPGMFQATILGNGHLAAYIGYKKIAELKRNKLETNILDVLRKGRIREKLNYSINENTSLITKQLNKLFLIEEWREHFKEEITHKFAKLREGIDNDYIATLSRLLLRMQNFYHGGALLITNKNDTGLDVKYKLDYNRLKYSIYNKGFYRSVTTIINDYLINNFVQKKLSSIPTGFYSLEYFSRECSIDSNNELNGCIWFISLLSRVDGLVLLNTSLDVQGFGVEIKINNEPEKVYLAKDEFASEGNLTEFNYKHFGTRHRSMIRYCLSDETAVGFVVSQDGDIRVISQVNKKVIIWENIRLRLNDVFEKKEFQPTLFDKLN